MNSRRAFVQITIQSEDITESIQGDVLSFSYTDNASDDADDMSIQLQNRTKKWLYFGLPQEGAIIKSKIITENWCGKLNCGSFIIDDISCSGWPLTADIKAVAMPVNEDFSETQKNKTWSEATIKEIASTIAGNSHIPLLYEAEYNPVIGFVSQTDKSDKEFLYNLCTKYGLTMKLYSNQIVIYDMVELEAQKSIMELQSTHMLDFTANSTISDTGYSACVVKYTTKDKKTLEYHYEIKGKTKKVYKHNEAVGSLAEAQRVARAKLRELNAKETTFSCKLPGNAKLVAGVCVTIGKEFGSFEGKYFIDKAIHDVSGGGGYTTSVDMHRVVVDYQEKKADNNDIKIGDIVQFLGGNHYSTSDAKTPTGGNRTAGPAKVTNIAEGALHPIHLIAEKGSSNVYGWVDKSQVRKEAARR